MICVSNGRLRSRGTFSFTSPAFVTSFFDESGGFNSIFSVAGNYKFDFSFQNIGGLANYTDVYLLVHSVPGPNAASIVSICAVVLGCWRRGRQVTDCGFPMSGLEAITDIRDRLDVVVKHAQLIKQGVDIPVDCILLDRILLGTDRIGDSSPRERMVRPARQE
jgi:hypothetical protein